MESLLVVFIMLRSESLFDCETAGGLKQKTPVKNMNDFTKIVILNVFNLYDFP